MAAIDWQKRPAIPTKPYCGKCKGSGIYRERSRRGAYHKCSCGRLPNATAALKLTKQDVLLKRLSELKTKGW